MTVLLAASLLLTPLTPLLDDPTVTSDAMVIGSAAYYSPAYDYGGWDRIIAARARWGQIDPETFPYSAMGYYCVQPDHRLGEQLHVVNAMTGAAITCTVADTVAAGDEAHWRAHAVIELSYAAFCAVEANANNRVVVWQD